MNELMREYVNCNLEVVLTSRCSTENSVDCNDLKGRSCYSSELYLNFDHKQEVWTNCTMSELKFNPLMALLSAVCSIK